MTKWYVYITDRSADRDFVGMDRRVFTEVYEAITKDEVKNLVLTDFDNMKIVREKLTKSTPPGQRFITTIKPMNEYWEQIFLQEHKCNECHNVYTKLQKLQMQSGGNGEFCSIECQRQHFIRFEPPSAYDIGTVYMITHKSTGKRYVGVTIRWVVQRWWEHMKADSGSPLHQLIKESDISDFTFEVLEKFKPSEADPYEREAYWIRHYNAVADGLNAVSGHSVSINEELLEAA